MPVGTAGTVKALTVDQVRPTGADILLGNTYHLMLRPGAERVARLGGLHRFMRWERPILTDSGGFQVMSLAQARKLDRGRRRPSARTIDGSRHVLTPERVDRDPATCWAPTSPCSSTNARPAGRATRRPRRHAPLAALGASARKAAFGERDRATACSASCRAASIRDAARASSAERLVEIGFDGYAIGGLAVGEPQALMFEMLDLTLPGCCRPTGRAT